MIRYMTFLLAFLLIVSVTFGGNPKKAEDRDVKEQAVVMGAMAPSSAWLPISTAGTFRGIAFAFDGSVWVSGYSGTNTVGLVSNVARDSWKQFTIVNPDPGITRFAPKNKDTACVGTFTGQILRTTNGGAKWDTVFSFGDGTLYINDIMYVDASTMVASGDADGNGLLVVRSTNDGATWTRITNLPAEDLTADKYAHYATYRSPMDVVGGLIFMTTYSGSTVQPRILRSDDKGLSWISWAVTLPGTLSNNYYFRSISFKDTSIGWAVGRRAYSTSTDFDNPLMKTTDGGKTWSDTLTFNNKIPHKDQKPVYISILRGTDILVATGYSSTKAMSWRSTDGGTTWTELLYPATGTFYFSKFLDASTGWGAATGNFLKYEQSVEVTILANTCGVPDTLKTNSFIQLRGGVPQFGNWGMGSTAIMSNIGGDYWRFKVRFAPGTSLQYKFFTNANKAPLALENEHKGWEDNLSDASGNRLLTVGNSDTTLPLQYVNGFKKNMNQYETPFTKHGDTTFVLYLRVNMQGWQAFNPAAHKVGVRGSNAVDWGQTGELGWGSSAILTQEQPHPNLGSRQYDAANLYSVAIHVPNKYRGAAAEFKFVIHNLTSPNNEDWGQMVANPGPQVRVGLPLVGDTTIYWMWFANQPFIPGTGKDTSTVTFRADMAKAVDEFGYTLGDSLRVDGGFQGTAETVIRTYMQPEGLFTTVYKATSTFTKVTIGANVNYQYYTVKNGIEYREIFFDFTYKGTDVTQAERRKTKIEGKVYTVNDTIVSISDLHRVPRFRNQTKLTKNVTVKLTCDLRPAIWQIKVGKDTLKDIQSGINVMVADSVLKWGLAINGPATGGWASWGTSLKADTTRKMYDDGTHGDVKSNDTVFTWTKTFTTADIKGQEFKFGIGGGDNEGGYGNNHIENISDAATTFTLATQWGSIDPLFYDTWDYELKKPKPTGVEVARSGIPVEFTLDQNFPNPFNPATVIQYSIPKESQVTLKIYNMLGQEVMTLVNDQQKAGYYKFTLNASKLASGVYFYQVVADKYVATKKMLLLK